MIAYPFKAVLAAALFAISTPAMAAAPVCGATPRIEALQRAWSDPHGSVMIASHRGGHLAAPENSLAAVDEAAAAGTDFVEMDVRVSSDGVPFIMHDGTVNRTTGGTGKGEDMTYAQLRALRLKGGDTPPPTLLEMLRHTCGRVLANLDMKTDRVAPVVAVIQGLGMVDQVQMFDSDSDTLRAARALEPRLHVMTRLQPGLALASIDAGLAPVGIVHGDPETLTPQMVREIGTMPARIWGNALGATDKVIAGGGAGVCPSIKALRALGISAIQTDYPALLRAHLKACALDR